MNMVRVYMERYEPSFGAEKRELEHKIGRKLLCQGLKDLYGIGTENGEAPPMEKGPHGKPCLKDFPQIHFNISHTEGRAVCAIGEKALGIDIERVHPYRHSLLKLVLSESERDRMEELSEEERGRYFFRIWTLKESYGKAKGFGLTNPLTDISFDLRTDGGIRCSVPGLFFYQKVLEEEYILSLCTFEKGEISFAYNSERKVNK